MSAARAKKHAEAVIAAKDVGQKLDNLARALIELSGTVRKIEKATESSSTSDDAD
jgi:hypothetical protein